MNQDPTPPTAASSPDGAAPPAGPPGLGARRAVWIFAAFLGVQVLVTAPAAFWAGLHASPSGAGDGLRMDPGLLIFLALVGTVWAGFIVLWMTRRSLPGAMALIGWAPASLRACGGAALQGIGLVLLLGVVGTYLPMPKQDLGPLGRLDQLGLWASVAGVVLVTVVAPPVEELMFRGVLYTGLARRWGTQRAASVTTVAFVAMHVPQLSGYWPGWVLIGLVGLLALHARLTTGSLLPAIALHASYNLGLVLAAALR